MFFSLRFKKSPVMPGKGSKRPKDSTPTKESPAKAQKIPRKAKKSGEGDGAGKRVRQSNPGTQLRRQEEPAPYQEIRTTYLLTEGLVQIYREEQRGEEDKIDLDSEEYLESLRVPQATWVETAYVFLPDVVEHLSGKSDGTTFHLNTPP
jgi:hypothetical protein